MGSKPERTSDETQGRAVLKPRRSLGARVGGDSNVDPGIWNTLCTGHGLSLSKKLTLEIRRKSAERQSKLPGAVHGANGDTQLVRRCLHQVGCF